MSLIKKTYVLSGGTPKGYATIVRVGNETGIKIVGESIKNGMKALVKIAGEKQTIELVGKRTEASLNLEINNGDSVSVVIYDENGVFSVGGKELSDLEKRALLAKKESETSNQTVADEKTYSATLTNGKDEEEDAIEENPQRNEENEEENNGEGEDVNEGKIKVESKDDDEEESEKDKEREGQRADEEREMLQRIGEESKGYYVGISDKIDELFVVYPEEKRLSETIPDSEWVKVKYDGEDYYVVGKLKDEGKVRYLGYGVPGKANVKPPKSADGIAEWLPIEGLKDYDGYWLFFQDAETGKIDDK